MKLAISVPDPVFRAADQYAKERNIPRSQLIAEALEAYLAEHGPETVTAQLNRVYQTEASGLDSAVLHAQTDALKDEAW